MAKKKVHHEEHVDETWLIPYADMLTLLLALFIVMFAMGQVDKQKMESMSQQFNIIFAGGAGMMDQTGKALTELQPGGEALEPAGGLLSSSEIENDKMNVIKSLLEEEVNKEGYSDKVKITLNREGLEVSIQDVVLFNSGEATVLDEVSPLLVKISKMLSGLDNNIKIVGHTDNVPIKSGTFRSNWDLSAMRAINVMNFMVGVGGLHPEKFSIQAYGEYMPKFDNSTADGRAKNRRVEIFIVRKYPVTSAKEAIKSEMNTTIKSTNVTENQPNK